MSGEPLPTPPAPPTDEKKENLLVGVKNSIVNLFKNPVTKWCSLATAFRFIGIFANDYFLPAFFLMTYPLKRKEFGLLYCLCVATGGLVSSLLGGVLADKFGPKNPKAYSKICMASCAIAWPIYVTAVLTSNNFYLAMACTYLKYLLGECFWSPNITMI
jgi:nitrate/nitrite transporter NarK